MYTDRSTLLTRNQRRLMAKRPQPSVESPPMDLAHMLPPPVPSIVSMAIGAVLRGHSVSEIVDQTRQAHINRRQMKQFLSHPDLLVGPKGVLLD